MDITTSIFLILILIISVMFHELAHGTMADWLGDPTPRLAGRLTLNPFAHLEWVGSFFLPLLCILSGTGFIIGWAKPVPFNPNFLKYKRWGAALVAVAGPVTNMLIAGICAIIFRFTISSPSVNVQSFAGLLGLIVTVNITLAIFNLIPIPPLDGHHILGAIVPAFRRWSERALRSYGFVILILVLLFAGSFIMPITQFFTHVLLGV